MPSRKKFPVKLVGDVNWVGAPNGEIGGEVTQALWRSDNEIYLQCKSTGYEYGVSLAE